MKLLLPFLLLMLSAVACGKICWEECSTSPGSASPADSVVLSADIVGCRRRSSYPRLQGFFCRGTDGPPCTVLQGDNIRVRVNFTNPGLRQGLGK